MNKNPLKKSSIFNILKNINKISLGQENISLDKSLGRFLDQNIISRINLPPFNNSAVDGYALTTNDIKENNKNLIVSQRIAAGDFISKNLKKGHVARIFTGAIMPSNSKTIVMQENTRAFDNNIKIIKMPKYGENCRLLGEDIKKKQKIFTKGEKINTTNINIIAAIGKKKF